MNARRRVVIASIVSLGIAILILITSILPAEYGYDPLGTGDAMGLLGLSEEGQTALAPQTAGWQTDKITFELAPFESVEYKYHMDEESALLFDWEASGEVVYDMHSEPEGAAPGYAISFMQSRGIAEHGNYTAPFPGLHGWFWQNREQATVTVTLSTAGYFEYAIEFRDGKENRRDFLDQP